MSPDRKLTEPYASPSDAPERSASKPKSRFDRLGAIVACGILLLGVFLFQPFVGITYRQYYDNEPLQNPVRVVSYSKETIELADGRVVQDFYDLHRLEWAFKHVDRLVEVRPSPSGRTDQVEVYGKEFNHFCELQPMIRIPLIPVYAPSYKPVLAGDGKCIQKSDLPGE